MEIKQKTLSIIAACKFWILAAIAFFVTIVLLSVSYASLTSLLSTSDKSTLGSTISSASWNKIVDSILELDSRTAWVNQAPIISTSNRSSVYTTTNTTSFQYSGTSVTFTVPPGGNRKYRITARAKGYGAAGNYMLATVSNSSASSTNPTGIPAGLGYVYEYAVDTGWHSTFQEGYVDLAPGTYTYYLMVYWASSYIINYDYDTTQTNIIVWPL